MDLLALAPVFLFLQPTSAYNHETAKTNETTWFSHSQSHEWGADLRKRGGSGTIAEMERGRSGL